MRVRVCAFACVRVHRCVRAGCACVRVCNWVRVCRLCNRCGFACAFVGCVCRWICVLLLGALDGFVGAGCVRARAGCV
jgi:hypothetical protein